MTARRNGLILGLVAAALAAAWLAAEIAFPGLGPSGIPTAFYRGAIHATVAIGLWLGLARTEFSARDRAVTWVAIVGPLTLWLIAIWALAANGFFRPIGNSRNLPLVPLAIVLPVAAGAALLTRSRPIAALLDAMPASWLIGLQVYRILGITFLASFARGSVPGAFALPAGIGDLIVGVLALPTASVASSRTASARSAAMAWNFLGLTDLTVAITMGILTFPIPTRMQLFGLHPNAQLGTYPMVMIPAFGVPCSILFHVLSIRQLRRLEARELGRPAPRPSAGEDRPLTRPSAG